MAVDEDQTDAVPARYEPPTIQLLGTLAELTQGGTGVVFDGDGSFSGSGIP